MRRQQERGKYSDTAGEDGGLDPQQLLQIIAAMATAEAHTCGMENCPAKELSRTEK